MAPEGSPERIDARVALLVWAKRARRRCESANGWVQNVLSSAPALVAVSGIEEVVRIANFVWTED